MLYVYENDYFIYPFIIVRLKYYLLINLHAHLLT